MMDNPDSRPFRRNHSSAALRGRGGEARFRNSGRGRYSFPPEDGNNRNRFRGDYTGRQREVTFANGNTSDRGSRIPRGRGTGNRHQSQNRHHGKQGGDPDMQWFRVEIPRGASDGRDFILRMINASLDNPITPFNYKEEGTTVVFTIDGSGTADLLRGLSRRITKQDGSTMIINVKSSSPPQTAMDDELKELIKVVMSRRYATDLGYLDLSNFRKDETFTSKELYVSLDRIIVAREVVNVILQNIPNLRILNLAENRLKVLEPFSKMKGSCSQLKAINLSKNKIDHLKELDHFKGLEIEEIWLKDNPCPTQNDQSSYIKAIRNTFPKIKKLDGDDLPTTIGFDVEVKTEVPATQASFIPEPVKEFANNFLKAFYDCYDSDDRQQLIAAYHDNAAFSYSIISRSDGNARTQFPNDLLQESRNLTRVNSSQSRVKLLRQGKINIIAAINSLPSTNHVRDAFNIDIPFFSNALVLIVVNGLVVETWKKQRQLRTFTRSFSIVPQGQGFVIINDMLLWTNSSYDQRNKFSAIVKSMNAPNNESGTSTSNKDQLVVRLRQETGMNENFSRQCLEESNFDYNTAVAMFTQLNSSGMIPPEAFS